MMGTVGFSLGFLQQAGQEGVWFDAHFMGPGVPALLHGLTMHLATGRGNILVKRPAESHIHCLHPPADSQDGQLIPESPADQFQFESAAPRVELSQTG